MFIHLLLLLQVSAVDWTPFIEKATQSISNLTISQKVSIVSGTGFGSDPTTPCVGNIASTAPIPGWSGLCLQDGPSGGKSFFDKIVRYQNKSSSSFPAVIALSSTWDVDLMYAYAVAQANEFRAKGANIALTPMMNMARVVKGGRNWEGSGEDPYLVSIVASTIVSGFQDTGVIAVAKHFYGNEQEHFRDSDFGHSSIDDVALHEIYLRPFAACIKAGVGAVMAAYNRILYHGELEFAGAHDGVLNKLLKEEMGFKGFVMSDWWAVKEKDRVKSAVNGLDMMVCVSSCADAWNCRLPIQ